MDMTGWSDITGDAIAQDVKFEMGLIAQLNRFEKMAIVSDKHFVAAFVKFMDPVIPTIDVRCFDKGQYADALAFASTLPAAAPATKPSATMIETGDPKLVAYEVDGTLLEADVDRIIPSLQAAFGQEGKVDLLVRMNRYAGIDPAILTKGSLFSTKLAAIGHIRRYAVVGGPDWMKNTIGMMGTMLPMAVRFFDLTREDDAWAWLKS